MRNNLTYSSLVQKAGLAIVAGSFIAASALVPPPTAAWADPDTALAASETQGETSGTDGGVAWKIENNELILTPLVDDAVPSGKTAGVMEAVGAFDTTQSWKDADNAKLKNCTKITFKTAQNKAGETVYCTLPAKSAKYLFSCFSFDDSNLTIFTNVSEIDLNGLRIQASDTADDNSCIRMFCGLENLTTIKGLETLDLSKVVDTSSMFRKCKKLKNVDLSSLDLSSVTDMQKMFSQCESLEEIKLPTKLSNAVTTYDAMFYACKKLNSIQGLEKLNTSSATDLNCMFQHCENLTSLDVSNFDTSHVENMGGMFEGCTKLSSIKGIENFNTEQVHATGTSSANVDDRAGFEYMFAGCSSLTELNLSKWNTAKVQRFTSMFENCTSLSKLNISGFTTKAGATNTTAKDMFKTCTSLSELTLGTNFLFDSTCGLRDTQWKKQGTDKPVWSTNDIIGNNTAHKSYYDPTATQDSDTVISPGTLVIADKKQDTPGGTGGTGGSGDTSGTGGSGDTGGSGTGGSGTGGTSTGSGGFGGCGGGTNTTPSTPSNPETPRTFDTVTTRLAGESAFDTMEHISKTAFPEHSKYAVLTTSEGYWDALSASSLAGTLDAPVLLSMPYELPKQTISELKRLGVEKVYICGGEYALSGNIDAALQNMNIATERVAGAWASDTANEVARHVPDSDTAFVATSWGYEDALSAASYAYAHKAPLFLANYHTSALDAATLATMQEKGVKTVYIVGGYNVVSPEVEAQLADAGIKALRIGGKTAYDTSALLARKLIALGMHANNMALATGWSYTDALTGAALCGKKNSVIILADDSNQRTIYDVVAPHQNVIENYYLLGGHNAVGDKAVHVLKEIFGDTKDASANN